LNWRCSHAATSIIDVNFVRKIDVGLPIASDFDRAQTTVPGEVDLHISGIDPTE